MGDEFSIIANSAIIIEVAVNPAKVVGLHLAATIRLSTGSIAGLPRIGCRATDTARFQGHATHYCAQLFESRGEQTPRPSAVANPNALRVNELPSPDGVLSNDSNEIITC